MRLATAGVISEIEVSLKFAPEEDPWFDGLGDGVVVLETGPQSALGRQAQGWRGTTEGRRLVASIQEELARHAWVEPERPLWLNVPLRGRANEECQVCVATAFDRHGPHPDHVRRAMREVAEMAEQHGAPSITMPVLASMAGLSSPASLMPPHIDALRSFTASRPERLRAVTFLVSPQQFEETLEAARECIEGTRGAAGWYRAIQTAAGFNAIRVLEPLYGGYSGARLDICEVADGRGLTLPLAVFKIGERESIQQEQRAAADARLHLGEYAIAANDCYELSDDMSALHMALASGGDPVEVGMSFLTLFCESGDPNEVATVLSTLFRDALQRVYASAPKQVKLWDVRAQMEGSRGGTFWSEAAAGFAAMSARLGAAEFESARVRLGPPVNEVIDDPFSRGGPLARCWSKLIEVDVAKCIHGDLNPRNVIVIREGGRYAPRLVDFHRFGSQGLLATDFARLEAAVHIECLHASVQSSARDASAKLREYAELTSTSLLLDLGKSLVRVTSGEFVTAVFATQAIRRSYVDAARSTDQRGYWACLALSLLGYLRPAYNARLSDRQRTFATYLAANALKRHVLPGASSAP